MSSGYPGTQDTLLVTNTAGDAALKAAVDALQAPHQRLVKVAATQNPAISASVAPDLSVAGMIPIQMPAGNITLLNPVNAQAGDFLTLIIIQDAIGGRTITWGSAYRKSITLSITGNARDSVTFRFDGSLWDQIGFGLLLT